MNKRIVIIAAIAVALALIAGFIIYSVFYNNQDHANRLNEEQLYQYNHFLTVFGRSNSLTGDDEVLIVDSISKTLGGDTKIMFCIYHYENESDLMAGLEMSREEIEKNSSYEYMGYGEVTLVDDKIAGMSNMKTVYIK